MSEKLNLEQPQSPESFDPSRVQEMLKHIVEGVKQQELPIKLLRQAFVIATSLLVFAKTTSNPTLAADAEGALNTLNHISAIDNDQQTTAKDESVGVYTDQEASETRKETPDIEGPPEDTTKNREGGVSPEDLAAMKTQAEDLKRKGINVALNPELVWEGFPMPPVAATLELGSIGVFEFDEASIATAEGGETAKEDDPVEKMILHLERNLTPDQIDTLREQGGAITIAVSSDQRNRTGDPNYNENLSQSRAETTQALATEALRKLDIDPENIDFIILTPPGGITPTEQVFTLIRTDITSITAGLNPEWSEYTKIVEEFDGDIMKYLQSLGLEMNDQGEITSTDKELDAITVPGTRLTVLGFLERFGINDTRFVRMHIHVPASESEDTPPAGGPDGDPIETPPEGPVLDPPEVHTPPPSRLEFGDAEILIVDVSSSMHSDIEKAVAKGLPDDAKDVELTIFYAGREVMMDAEGNPTVDRMSISKKRDKDQAIETAQERLTNATYDENVLRALLSLHDAQPNFQREGQAVRFLTDEPTLGITAADYREITERITAGSLSGKALVQRHFDNDEEPFAYSLESLLDALSDPTHQETLNVLGQIEALKRAALQSQLESSRTTSQGTQALKKDLANLPVTYGMNADAVQNSEGDSYVFEFDLNLTGKQISEAQQWAEQGRLTDTSGNPHTPGSIQALFDLYQ